MRLTLEQVSAMARRAAESQDWAKVRAGAGEILKQEPASPEGHFLAGLVDKASKQPARAIAAFTNALALDPGRYDAAIELAGVLAQSRRGAEALALLVKYEPMLGNSPRYLYMAGQAYWALSLYERAWPMYSKANELQPGLPVFQASLAACGVYLGKVEEAKAIYRALLERAPTHQRNHYQLSLLERATSAAHVDQMKAVLRTTNLPPERNIFLYYAIGKELEDLGQWAEAFHYYQQAGDAVTSVAHYDVATDIGVIDAIIETCDASWISASRATLPAGSAGPIPIFIVGLPRTGSTLVERILASHSRAESLGETLEFPETLRRVSRIGGEAPVDARVVRAAATKEPGLIAGDYLEAVAYRLGGKPMFIEKLPENFLYAGFIARAWPEARIVYAGRQPMDACLAMYKQSFFRFAYTLENLGRYYLAHDRLLGHWRRVLGDRLVEIQYESLVADQEGETRRLLGRLGLDFEPACLEFEKNPAASATASSVQVREKIHSRSIGRWRHFEAELRPLRDILESAGIATVPS